MRILKTISELAELPKGAVLTIGNFDGVHIGHQEIVAVARERAKQMDAAAVAMTFEPHPVAILYPEKAPGVLTPLPIKAHFLEQCGADYLIVLRDTASLLRLSPDDFIDKFLVKDVKPGIVVEGEDFHYGSGRTGNVGKLARMGKASGFEVVVVHAKQTKLASGQTVKVSSTMIRYMLESGHVADAAAVLGRPYMLAGRITAGRGKGKELGFPTLNMEPPSQIIPAEGVYAGHVRIADDLNAALNRDKPLNAVFSIGQARTFGDEHPLLVEAHILADTLGTNPGGYMTMEFIERIRPQHKFRTAEDLSKQIAKDCEQAKALLAARSAK